MSTTTTLSVLDLPTRGTKAAPPTFKGDYTRVQAFVDHYERLLHRCNVTDDGEKCKSVLQYCSNRVRQTIEGMPDYITPDWARLKDNILQFYDAERNDLRFSKRDLQALIRITRGQPIKSLKDFRRYQQEFIRIGGWLLGKKKITNEES